MTLQVPGTAHKDPKGIELLLTKQVESVGDDRAVDSMKEPRTASVLGFVPVALLNPID